MLLAWSDSDDLAGVVITLAVDESESLGPRARDIDLDPGEPGPIAAYVLAPECCADDTSMCEVSGYGDCCSDDFGPIRLAGPGVAILQQRL